jgi:tetratricopeptide (TPR) repeat protein
MTAPTPTATDRSPPRRRRRLRIASAVVPLVLALGLGVFVLRPRAPAPAPTFTLASERRFEPRVTHAGADRYRPLAAQRGAERGLASAIDQLVRRGDDRAAAAGWLLAGAPERAEQLLATAPPDAITAGHDSDRAAIALALGRPDAALVHADAALAREPSLAQALWNRGLALRDLGLPLAAAASFRAAADRGEPGWADEATLRAAELSAAVHAARGRDRSPDEVAQAATLREQIMSARNVLATRTPDDAWTLAERVRGEARTARLVDVETEVLPLLADIARRRREPALAAALEAEAAARATP